MSDDDDNDPLAKTLELVPLERYNPDEDENKILDLEAQTDSEYARRNIKNLIDQTADAFDDLIDVAKQAQSDKMFMALSSMMKTLVDANKQLVDLERTKKDIERLSLDNEHKKAAKHGDLKITQNNLYVTTADLLKMVKQQIEEKKDE